jgi:predicted short-subunit dehydrogenase-like oxidoreductase (DUF2520 family)
MSGLQKYEHPDAKTCWGRMKYPLAGLKSVAIVGSGRVGTALKRALQQGQTGYVLQSSSAARSLNRKALQRLGGPEVLVIATKDDAIATIATSAIESCGPNLKLVIHLAGSMPSTVLPEIRGVARLTLHPIQTFPKSDPHLFAGITFMASSENAPAIEWAKHFAKALGGREVITLPGDLLPLYHAMIVMGANFTTLLMAAVEDLSKSLQLDAQKVKAAMTPLIQTAIANALKSPAMEVLTGPLKRSDHVTIKAHRKALKKVAPEISALYEAFVAYATKKTAAE